MSLSKELRKKINECGTTSYRISKDTGIDPASLGRFVKGQRGLSLYAIEKLMDYFNLEVRSKSPSGLQPRRRQ